MRFRTGLLSVLAASTLLAAPMLAQASTSAKRPMTFADLQAMKRVGDPQISPSGKWVLFSVTDVSLAQNSKTTHLWAVPLAGGQERQLTTGSGESNGRFSPNGQWVMYSSAQSGTGQIWIAPWNDASGTLSAGHPVTALATGADGAIWAPDSLHFLFVSDVYPDCESHAPKGPRRNAQQVQCNARRDAEAAKNPVKALVFNHLLYRHWDRYLGEKRSHIFYGSVEPVDGAAADPVDLTPESVIGDHVAPTFSLDGPLGYAISPDGKQVAYVVNLDKVPAESTNNDIYTVQIDAEPSTAVKVSTSLGSDDAPAYSPDGRWLAWRSQARNGYESDKFDLVVMDRTSNLVRDLTSKFDGWVDEFAWQDPTTLIFASSKKGEEPLFSIANDGHWLIQITGNGDYSSIARSSTGILAAIKTTVSSPSFVVSLRENEKPDTRGPRVSPLDSNIVLDRFDEEHLTHINNSLLAQLDLSPMEPFWFSGGNGTKVEGFLIKPPNFNPAKKYPVKFLIHGGPQGAWGDDWGYRWSPELFAADGYVVVMVNPRGSTGYGQRFLEQVSGDWGGRPYIDLMKGLDYAEQHYPFIDKNRECALGASYGGYMADWMLTHTDRFKCIVTHDGMSNPAAAFGTTEELWFMEWEFRPLASKAPDAVVEQSSPAHPWDFYGKPEMDDPFVKWSPMRFIKNARTPTLIVHSQLDYRLDLSQGLELFTALQLRGVPSKMLYFPNESHWVQQPQDSALWYETVNDWCDRWTGTNKYAAAGPAKNPLASEPKPTGRAR